MPVSKLGPSTNGTTSSSTQANPTTAINTNNKQPTRQQPQQKEHYYSGSLHARDRGKVQETMQNQGNSGTLQGHQHRTLLGNRKDKDPKINQKCIIYHYKCPQINCPSAYLGESGRSLGERGQGTPQGPLPIHLHSTTIGHPMDAEQFSIVHKEVNNQSRAIKEAMFICIQDPTLNRNLGKY